MSLDARIKTRLSPTLGKHAHIDQGRIAQNLGSRATAMAYRGIVELVARKPPMPGRVIQYLALQSAESGAALICKRMQHCKPWVGNELMLVEGGKTI